MSAEFEITANFWTAVGSVGTCAAVIFTLLHAANARWFRIPRLSVPYDKIAVRLITHNGTEQIAVFVKVKNEKGTFRGSGAEKVKVSIRKIDHEQVHNETPYISQHKRSPVTWHGTNAETVISIPMGVEEEIIVFSLPKEVAALGGTGQGTGTPSTIGKLFIGDDLTCDRKAGLWTIWLLLSADSINAQQHKITINYKGGAWPAQFTDEAIKKMVAIAKTEEI